MAAISACLTIILTLGAAAPATVGRGASESFTGYAYDLESDRLVYRERHERITAHGEDLLHTVYECPDGRILAVRQVDFGADSLLPTYRIENPRDGSVEGARAAAQQVVLFNRASGQAPSAERRLERQRLMVADAGFDRFITRYWSELLDGARLEVDFIVPSRLRSVAFVISRLSSGTLQGEPTVRFRMVPANPMLRLFMDPIHVTYHRERRVLMRYEGLSNVRSDNGEPFVVRIDFPIAERAG